jgi:outer membrane protein OmpA-like peptidoglycan-associated protein
MTQILRANVYAGLLAAFWIAAPAAQAQEAQPDARGCKDSTLLSRVPGCWIEECAQKEFDSVAFYSEKEIPGQIEPTKQKPVEGATAVIGYSCAANVSSLQIARNAESALQSAGYTLLVSGKITNDVGTHVPAVVARKGGQWLQVVTETGGRAYILSAVREADMKQEMTADATAMAAEIQKTGHVAVYGIGFDTGRSTIKPESDAVLGEMVSLLTGNPSWKIRVEGHTDNVGTKALNTALSLERSAAVETWLIAHGVAKSQLTHAGYGEGRPVADNTTAEGRAKNRRVELVKI